MQMNHHGTKPLVTMVVNVVLHLKSCLGQSRALPDNPQKRPSDSGHKVQMGCIFDSEEHLVLDKPHLIAHGLERLTAAWR